MVGIADEDIAQIISAKRAADDRDAKAETAFLAKQAEKRRQRDEALGNWATVTKTLDNLIEAYAASKTARGVELRREGYATSAEAEAKRGVAYRLNVVALSGGAAVGIDFQITDDNLFRYTYSPNGPWTMQNISTGTQFFVPEAVGVREVVRRAAIAAVSAEPPPRQA